MQYTKPTLFLYSFLFFLYSYSQNITKDTLQARYFMVKADSLLQQAKYNAAVDNYKQASKLYEIHKLWKHYVKTENKLGDVLTKVGNYDRAKKVLENAIQIAKQNELEQSPAVASSYNNIGTVYRILGKYYQALEQYQKALQIKIEHFGEQHPSSATSYNNIGTIYGQLGKYSKALEHFKRALKIRIANLGAQHPLVAASYNNIGIIYFYLGKNYQAIEHHKRSLKIRIALFGEQHPEVAVSYNNIGLVYHNLGNYPQALEHFKRALKIRIANLGAQHPLVAASYNNIGAAYDNLRKYPQALEQYEKALKIYILHYSEKHPNVASINRNVGLVFNKLGNNDKALNYHKKSIEIFKTSYGDKHPELTGSYNSIGNTYGDLDQYHQALYNYQKALHSNEACVRVDDFTSQPKLEHYLDDNLLLYSLTEKGKTLQLLANDSSAIKRPLELSLNTYQVADTLIQQMRRNTWNEKDKLQLAENSTQTYHGAMSTTLQLYQKQQEHHYLDKAFYYSEQNRAAILLGVQSKKEALTFGKVPDSLVVLEKDLRLDKSFYTKQLQQEKDSAVVTYIENELFIVNRSLDSLTQLMETTYPDYYQMKYSPKIKSLNEVQSQLTEDELLLHYLWDKDILYGFGITKDKATIKSIPLDSSLLKAPKTLMTFFKDWEGKGSNNITDLASYQTAAYNVYQNLVAPLLSTATSKTKKLIIIPDGPLSQIPFEVLTTKAFQVKPKSFQSLPYLLKDYAIRYGFSASLTFEAERPKTNGKKLIAFGGFAPSYENANMYPQQAQDSLENVIAQRTLRTLYNDNNSLPPLKHNLSEVQTINDAMGGDVFGGEMATVEQFKRMASKYRILHIAAHGWVNDSLPEFSGIAFANNNKLPKNEQYNFLQMHEIYNINLNAELVVLSACQTGVGTFQQGEGVMNLGRAFRYAGSSNVLVSQWNVNDANTAELMVYFYDFLSEGMDKDTALQKAKLKFLDSYPGAHPFQWGAFTLWGNDTPISTTNTYWWYFLGIGFVLVVLLYIGYRLRRR